MKNKWFKLISLFLLMGFCFVFVPFLVFADEDDQDSEAYEHEQGQLLINPQAIQEQQAIDEAQARAIGYELAPFLFLEDMMEAEVWLALQDEAFLADTRERLFLEEEFYIGFDTDEIVAELFGDEEILSHQGAAAITPERYFQVPVWAIAIGVVVGIGFLIYIAIILGEKLGHVIHKNPEEKEEEALNG